MKAIVLGLTLIGAVGWAGAASAQYGYGVPGGYFSGGGGGGFSGGAGPYGGGSSFGIPSAPPSFGGMSPGSGSNSLFQGFTYSPYNYSSPSYGRLSPSFGGASSSLGFGTSSNLGFGTASSLGFPVPTYWERLPSADYGVPSYGGGPSHADGDPFRSGGFLSPSPGANFYGTGFGYSPTWRNRNPVRHW